MDNEKQKNVVKSVFKNDKAELIRKEFTRRWIELINQKEKRKK